MALHQFTDLTTSEPIPVLTETWIVHAYAPDERDGGVWFLDLNLEQIPTGNGPLELGEYQYGGIAMRGHPDWYGEGNAQFLTADGVSDRIEANAVRSRWCAISGRVDGLTGGLAIFDKPSNFRFTQQLRVHSPMPYFCYAAP
jgi:hypothetical protein